MDINTERHPLEPFLPENARILMLGSFPPPTARWSMDFFYPNWINDMWRIFGVIFFEDKGHFEMKGEKRFNKEMMAHLDGATYITRQSVHTPANVRKCKKAIRKAFENSLAGNGYSLVEVVATCSSGWKLSPVAANKWMEENMLPHYPLGDIKCSELPK